jgi:hypothetical protein
VSRQELGKGLRGDEIGWDDDIPIQTRRQDRRAALVPSVEATTRATIFTYLLPARREYLSIKRTAISDRYSRVPQR